MLIQIKGIAHSKVNHWGRRKRLNQPKSLLKIRLIKIAIDRVMLAIINRGETIYFFY